MVSLGAKLLRIPLSVWPQVRIPRSEVVWDLGGGRVAAALTL